jgi:hypothetical protein
MCPSHPCLVLWPRDAQTSSATVTLPGGHVGRHSLATVGVEVPERLHFSQVAGAAGTCVGTTL